MASSIHSTNQSENVFHTRTMAKKKVYALKFTMHFWIRGQMQKSLTNKLQQKVAIKSWLKKVVVHTCAFCILTHRKNSNFRHGWWIERKRSGGVDQAKNERKKKIVLIVQG